MKIIGYNSSHEASIAQYDTETKKVDFLYEEERFRRIKMFTPNDDNARLLCIERKQIETPDHFIGCSFDRRQYLWRWKLDDIKYDKIVQRKILNALSKEQLSIERYMEIVKELGEYIENPKVVLEHLENHVASTKHEPNTLQGQGTQTDDNLHGQVADQLDMNEFHYEIQHHEYHAECGYWFSPWREKEKAIAVVMDGGGCQAYFNEYPNYQEVETIYRLEPDTRPKKQYQRLSNYRALEDWGGKYFWENDKGHIHRAPDLHKEIDGCEVVFSSRTSMGMNFSSLSLYFGFDKLGRAAGKVMGAASYHEFDQTADLGDFTMHSLGNFLQQKSYEYTVKLIQKAIDLNPDVPNIILSGGYALNCTNNAKYLEAFPNHQFFVDPIAHDGGTAVGGAIRMGRAQLGGEDI